MQQLTSNTLLQGGKYKIEKVLGQGGFGITYLAYQDMLDRYVCIKEFFFKDYCERDENTCTVTPGTSGSKELVNKYKSKFLKEARTITHLHHPNIVNILDIFEENGTAYYVMDYIEGISLADMVKRHGVLSENVAMSFICKIGDALSYIHDQHIMHLDVKPANIMVRNTDNEPLLIDFGLSKQYDAGTGNQTSTTPLGRSPGYAPMEQYTGVSEFCPQTDVYSLGATLYKLVTGITPPQPTELLDNGLSFPSHVSPNIANAITQAMKMSKKERPESVCEFQKLLNAQNKTRQTEKANTNTISDEYERTVLVNNAQNFTSKDATNNNDTVNNETSQGNRGEDLRIPAKLTLDDAYWGVIKKYKVKKYIRCSCCTGNGVLGNNRCRKCDGTGRVKGEEIIDVKIPAGIQDGMIVTVSGKGNAGIRNCSSGDLLIFIQELPHLRFTRNELDICQTIIIPKDVANKGGKVPVHTLNGDVTLNIYPHTESGKLLRLKGKGLPCDPILQQFYSTERGDMIVKIEIDKRSNIEKIFGSIFGNQLM